MQTKVTYLTADTYTPVGIYLRLRDAFPHSLLLECTDYSSRQNAYSYISLYPIAGIHATSKFVKQKKIDGSTTKEPLQDKLQLAARVDSFLESLDLKNMADPALMPGVFGYTSYDAINAFDTVGIKSQGNEDFTIPMLKYDLYRIVIAFNHFNSTLAITELIPQGGESLTPQVVSLLSNRNATSFPFQLRGAERIMTSDEDYKDHVKKGINHCARGDVFQIVLSRRYEQDFSGDEFNVYRALRSINPSPYLFYFDFLDYKLFGSSPEAQLQVSNNRALINPIAGTVLRSGDPATDSKRIKDLLADPKENSEHAMLVDLARNDLSRHARDVKVDSYREVHTYSHVIHLVSTVSGELKQNTGLFRLFGDTFPAGTLSGAPKHRAVQLIDEIEGKSRGFYGGAIGFMGPDNSLNHAIMIRSFLSKNGTLVYQAGAGVVIGSTPEGELNEVNGKISALRKAVKIADSGSSLQQENIFTHQ